MVTTSSGAAEVLHVANKPGLTESGGGHGAKGVDFQRWWSVLRMLELEQSGAEDFLLLFESVQDVTELDSASTPTFAHIYQVKKKDRNEWSFNDLTGTTVPKSSKSKPTPPIKTKVEGSPLGKLHLSLEAFPQLPVDGYFISNAGFDLPLATGGNAATSMPCTLADLAPQHVAQLTDALQLLCGTGAQPPDLHRLKLKKVPLHPDVPNSHVIHVALDFLRNRSPRHAGQAASFAESLVTQVSPLGRHTDVCASFEELVKERGFARSDFVAALGALEATPDYLAYLEDWLKQLQTEGMDFMLATGIRSQAARLYSEKLLATTTPTIQSINEFCDQWIKTSPPGPKLLPFFETGLAALKTKFTGFRDAELMARFALRAIKSCVDPT
ncbi:DUF4297 domain-containing protein [Rhodoferax aquaticus]|uniref:DUF4297 domain-containing protein n=1 Tax=Rhodoferax aquaticus TaxID=2527691 RepID=A0A515EUU5_9BURK|nr:DUF4297 domain-containing protein [Rhodoferax aquaticus]